MQKSASRWEGLGKYREIILAVAFFLIFDLAVLVLNFYISFQMSASAVEINLAGRQRMLSQRMTKELLLAVQNTEESENTRVMDSLAKTVKLFDTTLSAFKSGGLATGGDGKTVQIDAVLSKNGKDILQGADVIWAPLYQRIEKLLAQRDSRENLLDASQYASAHNDKLLAIMNKLTTDLEQSANARATLLRQVQTIGIVLALINFMFILFKFIRRLRDYDSKIEQAHRETDEILATVREGLFLLDSEFHIGSQFSLSLTDIMGVPIEAGKSFLDVLKKLLPKSEFEAAREYINLLFQERIKESLVQELNPLSHVAIFNRNGSAVQQHRYLTMQFNRVVLNGKISHLLVTVFDVTAQVELEQQLQDARKKAKAEVEVMLDILKVNPSVLRNFLDGAEKILLQVNDELRSLEGERDYRRLIAHVFREIHSLKGEAGALGLELFEETAQQFEDMLVVLRDKGMVSGADLLALPLPLDDFLNRITSVRDLSHRLATYHESFPSEVSEMESLTQSMKMLVKRIASENDKQVNLVAELDLINELPKASRTHLKEIALQLLRNAVVHGLERSSERIELGKPSIGNISISLKRVDDEYEFVVRDDGYGLIPSQIRQALIRSGVYTHDQVTEFSDKQVIMKIFDPGVTTVATANRDAGRGVGMDVVKHKVMQLDARLRVATRKHGFTQFSICFAA